MGIVNGHRFVPMAYPEWAEGINNVGGVGASVYREACKYME